MLRTPFWAVVATVFVLFVLCWRSVKGVWLFDLRGISTLSAT